MFLELFGAYLEGDAVGSTKGCARVFHYKMQRMRKVIQKLGLHASNLCFVGERNSNMDSLNLGENLTIGQNEQEPGRMGYV